MKRLKEFLEKKSEGGFTLLEIVVSLAIFAILVLAIANILIINMRAGMRVKAKNYAREESSFMLNILKKDIRNAELVSYAGTVGSIPSSAVPLEVVVRDESGTNRTYAWYYTSSGCGGDGLISREELTPPGVPSIYKTPCDLEVSWDSFDFATDISTGNSVINMRFSARAKGMRTGDSVVKEVSVATRNFEF